MKNFTFPKGRYLITGGAGFIGSHLSEKLLSLGCQVVTVDNYSTGRPENIQHLLGNKDYEFIFHDVVKPFEIKGQLAGIFHLASPASPVDYARMPIETLHVGAIGSDNVLKIAVEKKCPILVTSTSEVYGDPKEHPQKESYWGNVNPIGPRGCYDESKRYLEAITMAYHRVHGIKAQIIRIFNTYGPRMRTDDGRVVPNFCAQAILGKDITIYGNGKQTRSFCFVSDMVDGIMRAIHLGDGMPVNIGNPVEYTILSFAEKIIEFAKAKSKLVNMPLPEDDPKTRCPDITRAKETLGWEPKVQLDEGLRYTFDYFRSQLEGSSAK